MSEMVERVARRLAIEDGADDWDLIGPVTRGIFERNARAAIEAMREPTDDMMHAVGCGGERKEWLSGQAWRASYQAMIDEALKD